MNRLNQNDRAAAGNSSGGGASVKRTFLSSNPVMNRLNKVEEVGAENAATYGGITLKTAFFLLFSVAGIIVQRVIQLYLEESLKGTETFDISVKGFVVSMYPVEAGILIGVVIAAIVFQLLAFFAKGSTPVTGALYCATQGYFIAFLVFKILGAYGLEHLGALALLITVLIILVMAILYTTGVIRVTKKFRMVMLTLFITVVAASILTFVCSFIPFTRPMVEWVSGNLVLSIVVGVIFVIIAALFLICDFDTIDRVVNDRLPKKYEWQAAFGLSFTVLWLYLKVLDIIITIAGKKK